LDDEEMEVDHAGDQFKSAIQLNTTLDEKIAKVRHLKYKQVICMM
jgi:hypothetical protein